MGAGLVVELVVVMTATRSGLLPTRNGNLRHLPSTSQWMVAAQQALHMTVKCATRPTLPLSGVARWMVPHVQLRSFQEVAKRVRRFTKRRRFVQMLACVCAASLRRRAGLVVELVVVMTATRSGLLPTTSRLSSWIE